MGKILEPKGKRSKKNVEVKKVKKLMVERKKWTSRWITTEEVYIVNPLINKKIN